MANDANNNAASVYLDKEEQWAKLAAALVKAGEYGVDTETFNQPDKTSPQHRTRVHCWSVGILTAQRSPRGYRMAVGRVLPRAALDYTPLRDTLENPDTAKWAHNAPHDEHSLINEGVNVQGMQDSLQLLRVACPGRQDYGLKQAEQWALNLPARSNFTDLTHYTRVVPVVKMRRIKGCVCGKNPCRSKHTTDFLDDSGVWRPHTRVTWRKFHAESREVKAVYPVEGFELGHPRWAEWVDYSLADAVRGIMLVDWIRNRPSKLVAYPWSPDVLVS